MIVLGVTGNIGCGKSSVSNIFIENNIDVIDADLVAREIFNDKELLNQVFLTFGESVRNEDNTLNRKLLGNIVFNDNEKLMILNSLTHPKIKSTILSRISELKETGKKIIVVDAALLIEDNYIEHIDKLLLITCNQDIQIQRVMKRDSCTSKEALDRINSQMSQEDKMKFADYIIDNSGSLDILKEKVHKFIEILEGEVM